VCSNERLNNIELSSDNLIKCDITCISVSVLLFRRVEFPVRVRVRFRVRVRVRIRFRVRIRVRVRVTYRLIG
jgi:hypothetical protein